MTTRFTAAGIHLILSALLVGSVFAVVFLIWYPHPSFEIVGASSIVVLLVGIDLVLGPMLTLIIYRQGKPGLKFDLTVIVVFQLTALVYGAWTLYEERPSYLVFAVDRVEFVAAKDIDEAALRFEALKEKRPGTLIHAFARLPVDPEAFQRYLDSVVFDKQPDLERRAEFFEPWHAGADTIRTAITPLDAIEPATDRERHEIDRAQERFGDDHNSLGTLPVGGIEADLALLIDRDSLAILDVVHVNVW